MLPLLVAALIAPAAAAASEGRPLVTRGDGIIRSPVNAVAAPPPRLRARQNEIEVENQDSGTSYTVEIEVGTPPQKIQFILDTGSPDTWVNPTCMTYSRPRECQKFARFDPDKSSSINITEYGDYLRYGKGNATIQYAYETLTIGSATIENQIIGLAVETHQIPLGILGLSPSVHGENEYPYVLDTMVDQGLIKSRAFSLDLRGVDNPNGALIFGGVDTAKYIGNLAKIPILDQEQTPSGANRYYITMTGVGLTTPDGEVVRSEDIQVPVFLDSGGTLSQLPTLIYQAIASSFADAQFDPNTGFYYVPCDVTELDGSVDFYFPNKTIRVPLNDFIWQTEGFCILGVVPNDEEPILGDTFLRAAYVVHDQDNRNLHLAQAANCGENLVAISSGPDAVPSVKGKCTALPTATGTGKSLDVSATRAPASTFTGSGPTAVVMGPGPAASKEAGSGGVGGSPQATGGAGNGDQNAARRGVMVGVGAVFAVGVNLLAWVL